MSVVRPPKDFDSRAFCERLEDYLKKHIIMPCQMITMGNTDVWGSTFTWGCMFKRDLDGVIVQFHTMFHSGLLTKPYKIVQEQDKITELHFNNAVTGAKVTDHLFEDILPTLNEIVDHVNGDPQEWAN